MKTNFLFVALALFAVSFSPCQAGMGMSAKKGSSVKVLGARISGLSTYEVDGSVTVSSVEDRFAVKVKVFGLTHDGTSNPNFGYVHIHDGTDCSAPGAHLWNTDEYTTDPWNDYDGGLGTRVYIDENGNIDDIVINVDIGLDSDDVKGRTVVIHDQSKAKVACGVLRPNSMKFRAKIRPFDSTSSWSAKDSEVVVEFNGDSMTGHLKYEFENFEKNQGGGGLHIHSSNNCVDANSVGPHWWNPGTGVDNWFSRFGTEYSTNSKGDGKGEFFVNTGFDNNAYYGRPVVAHNANTGDKIACGVLMPY